MRSENGKNNRMRRLICSAVRWIRNVSIFLLSAYFKGERKVKDGRSTDIPNIIFQTGFSDRRDELFDTSQYVGSLGMP